MKRPTPIIWLIHADLFLLDRVAQPAVDFCSRRWGWHFVKIGETLCVASLAVYVAAIANFLSFHTDPFVNGLFLVIGPMFVAIVRFCRRKGGPRCQNVTPECRESQPV